MDWGLLYMFGGALSLGKLLTGTGADVAIGINLSFTMPTSIRAIPVGYGLKPSFLAKRGIVLSAIIIAEMTLLGWALIKFWPAFSL